MTAGERLRAHWRPKLGWSGVLALLFWTGYSYLGRHAFFPLRTVPLTWFDRSIPFSPGWWGWVYLSQFLYTGFLPWLLVTREEIRRYVTSFALLSGLSFLVFFLFPVASPRPDLGPDSSAMLLIAGYDGALNAFPSLHAGFLVLMAMLAWRLAGPRKPWPAVAVGLIWGGAILYATIATRQHYAIDLVAGAALGALAGWLAWRTAPAAAVAVTMRRN